MNRQQKERCPMCGNPVRRVHVTEPGTWCWSCEPYRAGAAILPPKDPGTLDHALNKAAWEFLKAAAFILAGYGWAVMAYGIFPLR